MAAVEDRAGMAGAMWAAGVLVPALVVAVLVCCRLTAAPLPAALATILACAAASPGFSARPQVFSYLFVLVATVAWLATLRDTKPRQWLIVLTWLQAPVHGMCPLSLLIAGAAIAGLAIDRRPPPRRLFQLAAIPVPAGVIVLAAPSVGTSTPQW